MRTVNLWLTCLGVWALCFGGAAALDASDDAQLAEVDPATLVCSAELGE